MTWDGARPTRRIGSLILRGSSQLAGGTLANRTAFSKCGAHDGAESVQISTVGWIQDVSSIVPAFRKATPGIDSIVLNIDEPQAEQKRRSVVLW